jgi:hypothetical protein
LVTDLTYLEQAGPGRLARVSGVWRLELDEDPRHGYVDAAMSLVTMA